MKRKVLIAGGGTGGHIYPALAIAKAIRKIDLNIDVEFVGTSRGLENKIIPAQGFKLHLVDIGRLNKNVSIVERITTLLKAPLALWKSLRLLLKTRAEIVLGVGGFASGPVVLVAALMGRKTFIWEPNAYPGLANRILSRFVDACLVVFSETGKHLKAKSIVEVGMPVREEIENIGSSQGPQENGEFHILLFGGSQGARPLNNALSEAVTKIENWTEGLKIVHQTGSLDYQRISETYRNSPHNARNVEVLEYLNDMPDRYRWADLVISRAGTGTLSELAASGKVAILIPLPSAADDHQTQNAKVWVSRGGGMLLPQSELTPQHLVEVISKFKSNKEEIKKQGENLKRSYVPGAADKIARILLAPYDGGSE